MKQNINLTINIPIDTPNLNGTLYTRDAFQEACTKHLPIIDHTSDKERVFSDATPASIIINKSHKNEDGTIIIDDFRFVSMSINMEDKEIL